MACRDHHPASETCPQCEFDPFVRNHYFTGKLMGAADFVAESLFHGEKMRHHNVRLHGSGVVCGLEVREHTEPRCQDRFVVVQPGSALDCCGHEILVPGPETIDLAGHAAVRARTGDGRLHTLQVAVCFRECPTEDVPVLYDECGCDDTRCAPNRILESYALDVLVDPPLTSGLGAGTAGGGFVAAKAATAVTGYTRAGSGGRLAIVDPGNPARIFLIDSRHRSMVTVALPVAAIATAMSQDGARFFVATEPAAGGAPECLLRVYNAADGTEIAPAARPIPNSTVASKVSLATTAQANPRVLAFDAAQGRIFRWQDAGAAGDIAAVAGNVALVAGGTAFCTLADATYAFALDPAGQVQTVPLGGGAAAPLQWNPAKGDALAAFQLGGRDVIAIAAKDEKRVYLVERQAGGAHSSIDLEHPPVLLGVIGPAASPWLEVYEDDAGHGYVQAILLDPANPPIVAAARSAGTADPQVVLVYDDGQAATMDPAALADGDCASLVCKQTCADCDVADCVVLATIANYRATFTIRNGPAANGDLAGSVARIDGRNGRRMLASTATLQAWLECLQLKGGVPGPAGPQGPQGNTVVGPPGPAGVLDVDIRMGDCATRPSATLDEGLLTLRLPKCCDDDLTHICYINWKHAGPRKLTPNPEDDVIVVAFDRTITTDDVNELSFIVETLHEIVDVDLALPQGPQRGAGRTPTSQPQPTTLMCWCEVAGEHEFVRFKDPCKEDLTIDRTATEFNAIRFRAKYGLGLNRIYRIRILGDLIRDISPDPRTRKPKAIDANHLPPWVSGGRKTGDCIEGGTFLSWFKTSAQRR